jgi:hypothetical protein
MQDEQGHKTSNFQILEKAYITIPGNEEVKRCVVIGKGTTQG